MEIRSINKTPIRQVDSFPLTNDAKPFSSVQIESRNVAARQANFLKSSKTLKPHQKHVSSKSTVKQPISNVKSNSKAKFVNTPKMSRTITKSREQESEKKDPIKPITHTLITQPRTDFENDVMISYSHQNADLMRTIRKKLNEEGISVWVDEDKLAPGVNFLSKIGKAVIDSKVFLQILTMDSVVSKYCKDELHLAYVSKKTVFVVADSDRAKLEALMDFGQKLSLSNIKFINIISQKDFESSLIVLCENIKRILQKSQNETAITDVHESEIIASNDDVSPNEFWRRNFTNRSSVSWTDFFYVFEHQYKWAIDKIAANEQDRKFITDLLFSELVEDDEVTLRSLQKFCSLEPPNLIWTSTELQALQHYAIKQVLVMESTVRLEAIEGLSRFQSVAVIETLLDLLQDPDANVRAVATITLAKSNFTDMNSEYIGRMVKMLDDPDRLVREAACIALGHMKAVDQVPLLVSVWRNDVISVVREAAQLALELIGGEEASQAIHMTKILTEEIKTLTSV